MGHYPEYKDSGIEWVGKIPKHWVVERNKRLFGNRNERGYIDEPLLSVTQDRGVLPRNELDYRVWNPDENLNSYKLVKPGDWVISLRSFEGGIELSEVQGIVSPAYTTMFSRRKIVNSYFKHLLKSVHFVDELNRITTGIRQGKNIAYADFSDTRVSFPPINEQHAIANFLDHKTAQIDELIRAKERKIELLGEYRASLINQVVTKGLDPNAEMKLSGVELIGEIPKHWEVRKLKYVAKVVPSYVDKLINPDEISVKLCNYTDVYYNDYITVDTIFAQGSCNQSEYSRSYLRKDDVIITSDSETPDDIGVPAYVKDDLHNVVCGYHLTIIEPTACLGGFIFRFIQSNSTRKYFELNSNGITRFGLKKAATENLLVPLPPEFEQGQIADFLDRKTKQIDELRSNEEGTIKLLKEYRQSLISEAVTGKIDVRGEV